MKRNIIAIILGLSTSFLVVFPVSAHVIITPNQVGIGKVQEFIMSVPTEKDNPTIGVKLMIPSWIRGDVVPNVKPGWVINVLKKGDDVTEIDWTGGEIPPGERDNFLFQAQAPASEVTLKWKAIQEYKDGSTVEWIHDPTSNPEDDSAPPPYSTTKVINDLTSSSQSVKKDTSVNSSLALSVVAVALSVVSLATSLRKRKIS